MSSRGQPTPPFNSPYQHAIKSNSYLHTPAYPSPARSDSEASRYHPEGLGLYDFHHPFSGASVSQHNAMMFPPSPQPTEAWANMSNGTSPMMQDPIVDPWTSGAYDHPVISSPGQWPHYEESHKSALPSPREASVFSRHGSENGFVRVKVENGSVWASDDDMPTGGTIAPGKLLNPYPHEYHHMSPMMAKLEPSSGHGAGTSGGKPQQVRLDSPHQEKVYGSTPRVRRRRAKSNPEDAKYICEICGQGFVRRYNKKSHLRRHQPDRQKSHKCDHEECTMRFDRKTDLDRHIKSVHDKIRDLVCGKCGDSFSRKDTLRR